MKFLMVMATQLNLIYEGLFAGTVLAEVEFPTIEEANSYTAPSWFIKDVTNDSAYHNSNMSKKVF